LPCFVETALTVSFLKNRARDSSATPLILRPCSLDGRLFLFPPGDPIVGYTTGGWYMFFSQALAFARGFFLANRHVPAEPYYPPSAEISTYYPPPEAVTFDQWCRNRFRQCTSFAASAETISLTLPLRLSFFSAVKF